MSRFSEIDPGSQNGNFEQSDSRLSESSIQYLGLAGALRESMLGQSEAESLLPNLILVDNASTAPTSEVGASPAAYERVVGDRPVLEAFPEDPADLYGSEIQQILQGKAGMLSREDARNVDALLARLEEFTCRDMGVSFYQSDFAFNARRVNRYLEGTPYRLQFRFHPDNTLELELLHRQPGSPINQDDVKREHRRTSDYVPFHQFTPPRRPISSFRSNT